MIDPVFLVLLAIALFLYIVPRALGDRARHRQTLAQPVVHGRRSGDN